MQIVLLINKITMNEVIIMHIKWQWLYNKEYKNYKKITINK